MKNKWVETGINVLERIIKNWLREMWFTYKKAEKKTSSNTETEENVVKMD